VHVFELELHYLAAVPNANLSPTSNPETNPNPCH